MSIGELTLEIRQRWTARDEAAAAPVAASASQRLSSLDALRGFTMFWIIGGSQLVVAIIGYVYPPLFDAAETHMYHPTWQGFTALDMVMPLFLFVVGAAMPLAFSKRIEPGQPLRPVYLRIVRRVAVLWIFGIGIQLMKQVVSNETMALELFSNTLQAIAVGYLVTSLALIHLRVAGQIVLMASLIIGYWALLAFVPFPGHPAGTLERQANLPRYIDTLLLDVFRRDHSFTWILTSLGFSASVLLGGMAGHLLRAGISTPRRLLLLVLIGLACMAGGWFWSYSLPINRHLWTSSMILWAGGWSFLLLALFHAVIDVGGFRRWIFPLTVIGSNALLAYMLEPFVYLGLRGLRDNVDVLPASVSSLATDVLLYGGEVAILWLILWCLYRQRLFLPA
jgi:predicted acyltransferase